MVERRRGWRRWLGVFVGVGRLLVFLAFGVVSEAVAWAFDGNRRGVKEKPIEESDGEVVVAEIIGPHFDGEVARDDGGAFLVTAFEDLVEELGFASLLLLDGIVAEVVDDQEVRS